MCLMCPSLGADASAGAVMIKFGDGVPLPTNRMGLIYLIWRCQLNAALTNKLLSFLHVKCREIFACSTKPSAPVPLIH